MGAERKSAFISDEVKKMTAYHEAREIMLCPPRVLTQVSCP